MRKYESLLKGFLHNFTLPLYIFSICNTVHKNVPYKLICHHNHIYSYFFIPFQIKVDEQRYVSL